MCSAVMLFVATALSAQNVQLLEFTNTVAFEVESDGAFNYRQSKDGRFVYATEAIPVKKGEEPSFVALAKWKYSVEKLSSEKDAPVVWKIELLGDAKDEALSIAQESDSVPSAAQLHTLDQGIIAIVHFGLNTFIDKEWSSGDTPSEVFNPGDTLDARQWVVAAKAGGIRRIVLVCKHHDGFCLWPSKYNKTYTVANTPWKDGNGDLVREVSDAAREAGLEFAAYISPWDRNHAQYATPAYTEYFHNQWNEIMTQYGPVWEVWLDGANGGTGYYGGANERRKIADYNSYYDYDRLTSSVKAHNPLATIFNLQNDISMRWPGNEKGVVPEDFDLTEKGVFLPPEADTPLRTKWFYHADDKTKSLAELADEYLASVGRSGILNLGLAPNTKGLLDDEDVVRLREFGKWVEEFNSYDASNDKLKVFDAVDLKEDIANGLKVKSWRVFADGKVIASGKQIGFRRIVRTGRVEASEVRLEIDSKSPVNVSLALRRLPSVK